MQSWLDTGVLYTVCAANNKSPELCLKGNKYDFVFIKHSNSPGETLGALDCFKRIAPGSKVIVLAEEPSMREAYLYIKYGAHDYRKMFRGFYGFTRILKELSHPWNIFGIFSKGGNNRVGNGRLNTGELSLMRSITKTAITCLLESRGEYETEEHLNEVGQYARLICEKLADAKGIYKIIDRKYIEHVYMGCLLHDIGKMNIPAEIIGKPGRLTEKEFNIVKTHSNYGYETLYAIEQSMGDELQEYFKIAKDIALFHHENHDGTGYPKRLKNTEIPLSARICMLADTYAAIRADRVYRKGFSHKETSDIILNQDKHKYDPELLKIFKRYNAEFEEISNALEKCLKASFGRRVRKQCAWCKSLFLSDKWMPYNKIVNGSHGACPKCMGKLKKDILKIWDSADASKSNIPIDSVKLAANSA